MTVTRKSSASKIKQKPGIGWYAMSCDKGGFLGTIWDGNSSGGFVRPRLAVVSSLNPPKYHNVWVCHGDEECRYAAKRSAEVLGIYCRPVAIEFQATGEDAVIVESEKGVVSR